MQIPKIGRLIALFVAILALPLSAAEKDKHSAKFGDLRVTVTKMADTQSSPHNGDHHHVTVFLTFENAGKGVICAYFMAALTTNFDLRYYPDWFPPKLSEMLPGETHDGSYDFSVKDGVQPLELVLSLSRGTIRCGSKSTEPPMRTEVRLDVHDLPAPEKPPSPQDSR